MGHLHAHFHVTSLSVLKTGEVYLILYSRWMTEMTKKLKSRPLEWLAEVYGNLVIVVMGMFLFTTGLIELSNRIPIKQEYNFCESLFDELMHFQFRSSNSIHMPNKD